MTTDAEHLDQLERLRDLRRLHDTQIDGDTIRLRLDDGTWLTLRYVGVDLDLLV